MRRWCLSLVTENEGAGIFLLLAFLLALASTFDRPPHTH